MMRRDDVQKMQDLYNQWSEIYPQLEASIALWKQAEAVLKPLNEFYGSQEWHELYETFNEPLDTKGNYSVLSEDAVWNALQEYIELHQDLKMLLERSIF